MLDAEIAEKTVQTNYYGTLETCQTFIPLVRPGGRVVNMSSTLGTIGKYSQALQGRFKAVSSINDVTALMEEFKQSAAKGTLQQHGWTAAAYAASKAGVIAATRILAEAEAKHGRGILINSCCPGYVSTDMTKNRGAKTPDQGAQTPVLLALGGIGGRYGLFWRDKKPANEV
jgi:carbonyl reductase 1